MGRHYNVSAFVADVTYPAACLFPIRWGRDWNFQFRRRSQEQEDMADKLRESSAPNSPETYPQRMLYPGRQQQQQLPHSLDSSGALPQNTHLVDKGICYSDDKFEKSIRCFRFNSVDVVHWTRRPCKSSMQRVSAQSYRYASMRAYACK